MSRILLVRHMPRTLSLQEKKEFLSQFGAENIWELRSRKDALFASFPTAEIAKTNLYQLHQLEIGKRRLVVEYSDEVPKPKSPESKDCTASQNMKKFLNDLYGFNPSLNFFQPPPPHLRYKYPDPTPTTYINIIYAMERIKPLYTQVLHLMNKMSLDPPFDENPEAFVFFNSMFKVHRNEAIIEPCISSESESEISSGEEQKSENPVVAKLPQRKHLLPKTKKRTSAILSSSIAPPRKKSKIVDQKEVFETVNLNESKKICVNVSKDTLARTKVFEPEVVGEIGKITVESMPHNQPKDTVMETIPITLNVTRKDIVNHRISYNDMKILPVFKNYNLGEPSMRLYLKNLAKNVSNEDVKNVYKCYIEHLPDLDQQGFDVRVMQEGRMKGQGFVTFPSVDIAKTALQETNGYMLNDRPMVVQFARVPNKNNP